MTTPDPLAAQSARIAELEERERALLRMLETSTVRLGILRDRMEHCDSERPNEEKHHSLSMVEVPAWIEEQSAAARAPGQRP